MEDTETIKVPFSNNYVFLEVMKDKKRCQYLIEKVLHIPIKRMLHIVAERYTSSPRISSKNIRLDVYLETLDGTVIDLEMQVTGKGCGQDGGQGAGGVFALCGQRPGGKPVHAGAG